MSEMFYYLLKIECKRVVLKKLRKFKKYFLQKVPPLVYTYTYTNIHKLKYDF